MQVDQDTVHVGGFFESDVDPAPLILLKCLLRSGQNFSFYRVRRLHLVFHAVIIWFMSQLNLVSHYIWCNNIDDVWGETGYLFRPVQGIPLARVVTDTQTCISVLINFVIKSTFHNLSGRRFMFMCFIHYVYTVNVQWRSHRSDVMNFNNS
jgi:hypothetical protein